MRYEIYKDKANEWRWRAKARNGHIKADSGEGYTRLHDCRRALKSFKQKAMYAQVRVIK